MAAVAQAPPSMPHSSIENSVTRPSSSASNPKRQLSEAPASRGGEENSNLAATVTVTESTPVENKESKESGNAKAGSSDKDKPADQASDVQRPPLRPNAVARSRLEQEPNPFEQSFRDSHGPGTSDRDTPPRGTDATSTRHNALPPLSSLTSPAAADPTQFPWLANQSLRSGPLSPAMLTGPQGANQSSTSNNLRPNEGNAEGGFESSGFRTGFTPGTGSGFTPGYNSFINSSLNSLPIPSPNTAAFLNSITNVTPLGESSEVAQAAAAQAQAQGQTTSNASSNSQTSQSQSSTEPIQPPSAIPPHMQPHPHHPHPLSHAHSPANNHSGHPGQDTITPNTLNALTGVFGDMSRAPAGAPGQNQFFAPAMSAHPGHPGHPGHPHNAHPGIPGVPGVHGVPGHPGVQLPMGYVDYAQHNANAASQAANGLFLLSQAHQELSKREEAEGTPGSGVGGPTGRSSRGGKGSNTSTPQTGSKRKSDGAARGNAKKGKRASAAATAASIPVQKKGGSTSGSGNGSEDEDDGSDKKEQKFETEEEKRKNFLERNRQAALKCRQRKKAWLNELQSKVEGLTIENERLQQTVQQMHDEVGRLTAILMQHRDCGLGIPAPYGGRLR
ncbi:bZip transcription factor, putative [Cryptococcus deneoformans JEC21]|uniref:BZip transcription factor, putative n=1 Tax=Cryptococcus deneoformans (strain JEC21 / ATCC MYA-565) TaxID=214684 RepID=Q5KLD2_CRYD1|nr:bZip transcription factor, putative [Cryptococcus neoformans var. neoformans JEC21]AAW42003.1 bZip transcription factor, putative [Cryptococcus neoformans var. neoformans JEC21]